MHASHLPVPPRQSAWSSSKENNGHHDDENDIVSSGEKTQVSRGDTEAVLSDRHSHETHQVHSSHRYPTHSQAHRHSHGSVSVHQTATEPYFEQAPKPAVRQSTKHAINPITAAMHDSPSKDQKAPVQIVSSAQPIRRSGAGFEPNSSFPPSYVGMPASTAGITIGRPEERK